MDKRGEAFNYRFHGNFNILEIAKRLEQYSHEWFLNNSRQETAPVHKETTSIFIYDHEAIWSIKEKFKPMKNNSQPEMEKLLEPIINHLEKIHNGKVGKCLFIKLPAGKDVLEHSDQLDYLGVVRRHHIAIKTNDKVLFFVNNESKNMQVGDCWEINNSLKHSVTNQGSTDRIHLLIDIMPNEFIRQ